jgi:hypothetical protein
MRPTTRQYSLVLAGSLEQNSNREGLTRWDAAPGGALWGAAGCPLGPCGVKRVSCQARVAHAGARRRSTWPPNELLVGPCGSLVGPMGATMARAGATRALLAGTRWGCENHEKAFKNVHLGAMRPTTRWYSLAPWNKIQTGKALLAGMRPLVALCGALRGPP